MFGFHRNNYENFRKEVTANPGKTFVGAAIAGAVIAGGLYLGRYLRRQRLKKRLPNFFRTSKPRKKDEGEYAVGI